MTYLQILNLIKDTALAQPNVNSVVREFLDLNREDAKYSAVVIQDRDGSRDRIVEQDYITYTWHLGYVDRLTYDESNRDDIISTGINIINNIVNTIRNTWFPELEVSVIDRINTFDQRFTAQCAGVYVVLAVNAQVSDCIDSESADLYDTYDAKITANGVYHFVPTGRPVDEIDIVVNVESQYKPEDSLVETITSNGSYHYDPTAGSVFSDVSIAVDVHPTDSLSRTYTSNGSYDITGEFNGGVVTVSVSAEKPEESLVENISSNGSYHYDPTAGSVFSDADITVDVHPTNKLVETITNNGTSNFFGEWKDASITVEVPKKTEESFYTGVTDNGIYNYEPEEGNVYAYVEIAVEVHPTDKLVETITSNGTTDLSGEWMDASITVDVHPSTSLSETYTSNGSYDITGEFNGGVITVAVPTTVTVIMTQAQYDALTVKDSDTIYLING